MQHPASLSAGKGRLKNKGTRYPAHRREPEKLCDSTSQQKALHWWQNCREPQGSPAFRKGQHKSSDSAIPSTRRKPQTRYSCSRNMKRGARRSSSKIRSRSVVSVKGTTTSSGTRPSSRWLLDSFTNFALAGLSASRSFNVDLFARTKFRFSISSDFSFPFFCFPSPSGRRFPSPLVASKRGESTLRLRTCLGCSGKSGASSGTVEHLHLVEHLPQVEYVVHRNLHPPSLNVEHVIHRNLYPPSLSRIPGTRFHLLRTRKTQWLQRCYSQV